MSFEVAGKLFKKFETEQKSERFKAREFVLEVEDGQYPQLVKFQLVQDRVDALDPFDEGDMINVHFDLRGRQWQDKFFTNLNAWRIERKEATASTGSAPAEDASFPNDPFPAGESNSGGGNAPAAADDMDDLPF